jgi:hypothetical protein
MRYRLNYNCECGVDIIDTKTDGLVLTVGGDYPDYKNFARELCDKLNKPSGIFFEDGEWWKRVDNEGRINISVNPRSTVISSIKLKLPERDNNCVDPWVNGDYDDGGCEGPIKGDKL